MDSSRQTRRGKEYITPKQGYIIDVNSVVKKSGRYWQLSSHDIIFIYIYIISISANVCNIVPSIDYINYQAHLSSTRSQHKNIHQHPTQKNGCRLFLGREKFRHSQKLSESKPVPRWDFGKDPRLQPLIYLSRNLIFLVGGWTTHLKNVSQNGKFSPNRDENKKSLKPPPSFFKFQGGYNQVKYPIFDRVLKGPGVSKGRGWNPGES